MEAALAAIGSQSEAVLNYIEDEQESGKSRPIDIDSLLVNIIPPILNVSGQSILIRCNSYNSSFYRLPILARQRLCICKPIFETFAA